MACGLRCVFPSCEAGTKLAFAINLFSGIPPRRKITRFEVVPSDIGIELRGMEVQKQKCKTLLATTTAVRAVLFDVTTIGESPTIQSLPTHFWRRRPSRNKSSIGTDMTEVCGSVCTTGAPSRRAARERSDSGWGRCCGHEPRQARTPRSCAAAWSSSVATTGSTGAASICRNMSSAFFNRRLETWKSSTT